MKTLLGIVVALPEELGSLTPENGRTGKLIEIDSGIICLCSGMGPENAHNASEALVEAGADGLMKWGCAASLNPRLKAGDLVLPERLMRDGQDELTVDAEWRNRLCDRLSGSITPNGGCLIHSDNLVAEPAGKRLLRERWGADIVDMESAPAAAVAKRRKKPFLAVCAVADGYDSGIPQCVQSSMDKAHGTARRLKVFLRLMFRPYELPALMKLARQFGEAEKTLKRVANHLRESEMAFAFEKRGYQG